MPDYIENTKIAIVGVILIAFVALFKLEPGIAENIACGLIGYIARGKES